MAIWHLAFALLATAFVALIIATAQSSGDAHTSDAAATTGLAGIVVGGGALLAGIIFISIGAILLRGSLRRSSWSLVLIPGLVGSAATVPATIIGWPTSELVGLFVAFKMVESRLRKPLVSP